MRSILSMNAPRVQIEITDSCTRSCANCSRFCGHKRPFFMDMYTFRDAVDSLVGMPNCGEIDCGIMGGEPLLHPKFEEICDYALSKIPRERLGLWTQLPKGFEKYREVIVRTFKHVFVNDHTRSDIMHHPGLVGVEEYEPDRNKMFRLIDQCWAQASWSASINPRGAFFCEIAAARAMLFEDGASAWKVEPGWWWRTPKDFTGQIERYCPGCGFPAPLRRRPSTDSVDDISPRNYERLKSSSLKVLRGRYELADLQALAIPDHRPLAVYKDFSYRDNIARRYGLYLIINDQDFWEPHLLEDGAVPPASLFDRLKERYA